jgi:hypothetical protein
MRPREHEPIDPEIAEQLDAIDATLAGEAVAPRFAELAELALLLSAERPEGPSPEFAAELDRRVEARFARGGPGAPSRASSSGATAGRGASVPTWRVRLRRRSLTPPVLGGAASALAAVVVAVVLLGSGGGPGTGGRPTSVKHAAALAPTMTTAATSVASAPPAKTVSGTARGARAAETVTPVLAAPAPVRVRAPAATKTAPGKFTGTFFGSGAASSVAPASPAPSPAPLPNGRKIVQSSMLNLGAPGGRIDAVAQEIFDVVGLVDGIVDSSNVSSAAGPGGYAEFQLRVPSASLSTALTELSRLRYANVISRSDATQDVNGSYLSTERRIAGARTALSRLRAQLAAATAETEILSLRAQIANEQATLAGAQASLTSLNRRVDYSRVQVSVQAATANGSSTGGGFGVGQAGHDALRVLEVTAGVALIVLAALVPVALVGALAWWAAVTVQRRRRERALDLA